jgi:hypothetical protein
MNNIHIIIIVILVLLNFISFTLGFVIGKISSLSGVSTVYNKPKSFIQSQQQPTANTISIDEKIHITDIKTDGMVKKYDNLGEVKSSNENITNSIEKLKKMKG